MRKVAILFFVIALYSCGVQDKTKNDAGPVSAEPGSGLLNLSNLSMTIPSIWKQETPTGKMRIAQFAYKEDPAVKLVVFYFGEQEMIEANIQRWKGQFISLESEKDLVMNDDKVTAIKLAGVFKKKEFPMAQDFTEAPGYAMLAAIVPSATGPYYFKVVAPEGIINKLEPDFISLINSN